MSCNKQSNTITYDEKVNGWTSFHSYQPDFMGGMNNEFFSFNNGELYVHHSDDVERNTFYGTQSPSKVSVMVNDSPSDVKELQALSLEGNVSWDAVISAYVGMVDDAIVSSIDAVEFVRKEGMWYAYARRNEDALHLDSKSAYGIGVIKEINGNVLTINGFSDLITTNDSVVKGSDLTTQGSVVSRTTANGETIMEVSAVGTLTVGDFIVGLKNSRVEGGNLRGYTLRVDLEVQQNDKVELFCVNSEIIKSYS